MSERPSHILVPVEFSGRHARAIEDARLIAVLSGARVTLLHVIETLEGAEGGEIREFYNSLERQGETKLAELARSFDSSGVAVQAEIVYGRRGGQIVQFANEHQVDLIVLSAAKPDTEHLAAALGTLSFQVSLVCNCSVLLVK